MVKQGRDVVPFMSIVAHASDHNTTAQAEASFEESDTGMTQVPSRPYMEDDMDSIDVHDLPEEQAQLLAAFVEFLRERQEAATREALAHERD
jgi:hypothetical protein